MPSIHKGQYRLPCTLVEGPSLPTTTTQWERQIHQQWNDWTDDWHQHGFPDDLSPCLCDAVHVAMTQAALTWNADVQPPLSNLWCEIIDSYAVQGHDVHHQAIWAFALWGRECLYDIPEQSDDVDLFLHIEKEYLTLLDDLPVSDLIDRLEKLQRARPPEDPSAVLTSSNEKTKDGRQATLLEPFDSTFAHMTDVLKFFHEAPVLDWPKQQAIPVCELPDGRLALLVLHLFSGRRREGDCHDWAQKLISRYFSDLEVVVLSVDTAVGGELCDLQGPGLRALHGVVDAGLVARDPPAKRGVQHGTCPRQRAVTVAPSAPLV